MPSDCGMRPWLLTFEDAALENAYQRYVLLHYLRSDDLRFFFVTTGVLFGLSLKTIQEEGMAILTGVPYFFCGVLNVVFWYVYATSTLDRQVRMRPYVSVIMRLCISASGSWAGTYYSEQWLYGLTQYKLLTIVHFLMATETFGNLPYAFGITTDFRLHLPAQFLTYLFFLFKAPAVCRKLGVSEGAMFLHKLESWLDAFFEFWTSLIQSSVGTHPERIVPKVPCLHSTMFLMTYFSMGFVSYSLWKWEKKVRMEFAARQLSHSQLISKPDEMTYLSEAIVLISIAAMYWKLAVPLTQLLAS